MEPTSVLNFMVMGLIGSFLSILRSMESWDDLAKFKYNRRLIEGIVIGYLYSFAVSEHGFPDQLVTSAIAYTGSDLIERLFDELLHIKNKTR